MSYYKAFDFQRPVICYSAMHQVRKGVKPADYVATMTDFHALLKSETAKIVRVWTDYVHTFRTAAVHTSRGSLSQFLTMPLTSDLREVERVLEELASQTEKQLLGDTPVGLLASTEGKVDVSFKLGPKGAQGMTSGRAYLRDLGFSVTKSAANIFESNFFVDGGLNLDILEHLVRDRIGIYTPVHGKHITEFEAYSYAAHNCVYSHGELSAREGMLEAAIYFSKGAEKYAPFRSGLVKSFESSIGPAVDHLSLWQRKLGLGSGREFVLRIRSANPAAIDAFVSRLVSQSKSVPPLRRLLEGHALMKHLLF